MSFAQRKRIVRWRQRLVEAGLHLLMGGTPVESTQSYRARAQGPIDYNSADWHDGYITGSAEAGVPAETIAERDELLVRVMELETALERANGQRDDNLAM